MSEEMRKTMKQIRWIVVIVCILFVGMIIGHYSNEYQKMLTPEECNAYVNNATGYGYNVAMQQIQQEMSQLEKVEGQDGNVYLKLPKG